MIDIIIFTLLFRNHRVWESIMSEYFQKRYEELFLDLNKVSLAMFRKNFFGIFHGSISARLEQDTFVINTRQAVFDNLDLHHLIVLNCIKDYRWNDASLDTPIHAKIYHSCKNAKFVAYAISPYSVSYSLTHDNLIPIDFFGKTILGEKIEILDPQDYDTWYDRAPEEISSHIIKNHQNILLIKGYGIYAFDRDLNTLAKKIALIENTCKILYYVANFKS